MAGGEVEKWSCACRVSVSLSDMLVIVFVTYLLTYLLTAVIDMAIQRVKLVDSEYNRWEWRSSCVTLNADHVYTTRSLDTVDASISKLTACPPHGYALAEDSRRLWSTRRPNTKPANDVDQTTNKRFVRNKFRPALNTRLPRVRLIYCGSQ